jgi:hypothetical protein
LGHNRWISGRYLEFLGVHWKNSPQMELSNAQSKKIVDLSHDQSF